MRELRIRRNKKEKGKMKLYRQHNEKSLSAILPHITHQ